MFEYEFVLTAKDEAMMAGMKALMVMRLTPDIKQYLEKNDPKALEQVTDALDKMSVALPAKNIDRDTYLKETRDAWQEAVRKNYPDCDHMSNSGRVSAVSRGSGHCTACGLDMRVRA